MVMVSLLRYPNQAIVRQYNKHARLRPIPLFSNYTHTNTNNNNAELNRQNNYFSTKKKNTKKSSKGGGKQQTNNIMDQRHAKMKQQRKPPKGARNRLKSDRSPNQVPPNMLLPTASPNVFISNITVNEGFDPTTLFDEKSIINTTIGSSSARFDYLSPKDFNHELPTNEIPEISVLGRSNVGKSSLLNALMKQSLCVTSKSPGRTQQPYYYGLFATKHYLNQSNNKKVIAPNLAMGYLVDLPGYGYTKAPESVADNWQTTTQEYLLNRRDQNVLQQLLLLLDCRRDGPMPLDRAIMTWLDDANIPYTIILTKADNVSLPQIIKFVNELCLRHASEYSRIKQLTLSQQQQHDVDVDDSSSNDLVTYQSPFVLVTSSKQGIGLQELRWYIETEFQDFSVK